MTVDVSDLDLDAELAALAQSLHDQLVEQGDALVVHRPPSPVAPAVSHRPRRARAWAAVAAAAATVLIIGGVAAIERRETAPSGVATEGSTTTAAPAGAPGPWRVRLDPASGYRLAMADRTLPRPADPLSATTVPGSTSFSVKESVWITPGAPTASPAIGVTTLASNLGTPAPGPGETAITVDGHPGKRSPGTDGIERISFSADGTHAAVVSAWGFGFDELTEIVSGSTVDADGRLVLGHAPSGLERRDLVEQQIWASEDRYDSVYVPAGGTQADAEVDVTVVHEGADGDAYLRSLSSAVTMTGLMSGQAGGPTSSSVEAITVHGRPALLTSSGTSSETHSVLWYDPATSATIRISATKLDRAATLALLDHLTPLDDSTWQQLSGRCPNPTVVGRPATAC